MATTPIATVLLFVVCALPSVAHAQSCSERTRTNRPLIVYGEPPRYSTRGGWQLGDRHDSLAAGADIAICERRMVGFVAGRKLWLEIAYERDGRSRRGWVFGEGATAVTAATPHSGALDFVLPRRAWAQDGLPGGALPSEVLPMILMYTALLLGIMGKGLYDWLHDGAPPERRQYWLKTGMALIVSPMVFLGINTAGDFQLGGWQSLLMYAVLAFQSGFFWQTAIGGKTAAATTPAAVR